MPSFIKSRSALFLITALLLGAGIFRFREMPVALYPMVNKPVVTLGVSFDGQSAAEFASTRVRKVTDALRSIEDAKETRASVSGTWASFSTEFDWSVEPDAARAEVERLQRTLEAEWPDTWRTWVYFEQSAGTFAYGAVQSEQLSARQLSELMSQGLKPRIEALPGVSGVFLRRFDESYVRILLHPERMQSAGITVGEVRSAIKGYLANQTLGAIERNGLDSLSLVVRLRAESVEDLEQIPVRIIGDRKLLLSHLATVSREPVEAERAYLANGADAAVVGIDIDPDANIKQVSESFFGLLRDLEANQPGLTFSPIINPAEFIEEAVWSVLWAMAVGMAVAGLTIFCFLGALRGTLLVCLSMPLSLAGGFILMNLLGIEMNLISMGGMALSVGMVVDATVVVLENLDRHFARGKTGVGKSLSETFALAWASAKEVAAPIFASILTTVIVFAPLPFTSPISAAILGDLAIVMVCLLCVSLVVSLVLVPGAYVWLGLAGRQTKGSGAYALYRNFDAAFARMSRFYLASLGFLLRRRGWTLMIGLICCAATVLSIGLAATQLPRSIISKPETRIAVVNFNFKTPVDDPTERIPDLKRIDSLLKSKMHSGNGAATVAGSFANLSKNWASLLVFLEDKHQMKAAREIMSQLLPNTTEYSVNIVDWAPSSLHLEDPPALELELYGNDDELIRSVLKRGAELLSGQFPDLRVSTSPWSSQVDELVLQPRWEQLERLRSAGVLPGGYSGIAENIGLIFRPEEITLWPEGADEVKVRMALPERMVRSTDELLNLLIPTAAEPMPLRAFFTVQEQSSWSSFSIRNSRPVYTLTVNASRAEPSDLRAVQGVLTHFMEKETERSLGLSYVFSETDKEITETITSLLKALALSFALILLVITLQFGSLRQTFVVLVAVPLGVLGSCLSLWIFRSELSMNSLLGLILLCGTAVNNSIMYVDFFNRQRLISPNIEAALLEAAALRLRPIAITTLTTIFGMMPIALGWGAGGEVLKPLGIAVSGGLWVSALLTLFAVPLLLGFIYGGKRQQNDASPQGTTDSGVTSHPLSQVTTLLIGALSLLGPTTLFFHSDSAHAANERREPAEAAHEKSVPETLEQFEQILSQSSRIDAGIRAQKHSARAEDARENAIWFELLPGLHAEASHCLLIRPENEGGDGCHFTEPNYALEIRQSIRAPWKWAKELQGARIRQKLISVDTQEILALTTREIRLLYIRCWGLVEELSRLDQRLALLEREQAELTDAFGRGRLSRQDLLTAELTLLTLRHDRENLLNERNNAFEETLAALSPLPQQPDADRAAESKWIQLLRDRSWLPGPVSSRETQQLIVSGLQALKTSDVSPGVARSRARMELAAHSRASGLLELSPDLALTARAQWNNTTRAVSPARSVWLTATWDLEPRVIWENEEREQLLRAALASQDKEQAASDAQKSSLTFQLQGQRKQLAQAEAVQIRLRELHDLAREQFEAGRSSRKELDDALRALLSAERDAIALQRNVFQVLAEVESFTAADLLVKGSPGDGDGPAARTSIRSGGS